MSPSANLPPGDGIFALFKSLDQRIRGLETQQTFVFTDSNLAARAQTGLLPNGDYGLMVWDSSGTGHEVNPFNPQFDATVRSTTSTSYSASGFPTITVPVGATGQVLILGSANLITTVAGDTATIGLSVDGATPTGFFIAAGINGAICAGMTAAAQTVLTGLSKGNHTFTYWLKGSTPGNTVEFDNAQLTVWPS